jgi:hypothetical protein
VGQSRRAASGAIVLFALIGHDYERDEGGVNQLFTPLFKIDRDAVVDRGLYLTQPPNLVDQDDGQTHREPADMKFGHLLLPLSEQFTGTGRPVYTLSLAQSVPLYGGQTCLTIPLTS